MFSRWNNLESLSQIKVWNMLGIYAQLYACGDGQSCKNFSFERSYPWQEYQPKQPVQIFMQAQCLKAKLERCNGCNHIIVLLNFDFLMQHKNEKGNSKIGRWACQVVFSQVQKTGLCTVSAVDSSYHHKVFCSIAASQTMQSESMVKTQWNLLHDFSCPIRASKCSQETVLKWSHGIELDANLLRRMKSTAFHIKYCDSIWFSFGGNFLLPFVLGTKSNMTGSCTQSKYERKLWQNRIYLYSGATVTAVTWPCHKQPSPSAFPKMYPIACCCGPSAIRQYSGHLAKYSK